MKIIPLVVGSSCAIPKQFGNSLKEIGVTAECQGKIHLGRRREN